MSKDTFEQRVHVLLVPVDPMDEKNGGDLSQIWVEKIACINVILQVVFPRLLHGVPNCPTLTCGN